MKRKIISCLRDLRNYYYFSNNPFGTKPIAKKSYYLQKFKEAKSIVYKEIDLFEKKIGFAVKKKWLNNLALHTQVVKKQNIINFQHGRVLYSLLRKYILENSYRNVNVFETGTARGFSSICMSRAIIDSKINGKIFTIDIIPNDKKFYWNCIDDHESKKTRKDLLSSWQKEYKNINFICGPSRFVLNKIKINRINFAFIDAMHDYENVMNEFYFVMKKQIKNDLIVFDDFNKKKFDEVVLAIKKIKDLNIYRFDCLKSTKDRQYIIAEKKI